MLLLLAGTRQAREIANALTGEEIPVIASLAGATRDPLIMTVKTRRGGFGGRNEFTRFLTDTGITAILDATHPFAARMTTRSFDVACTLDIPYMQLLRPEWVPENGDRWTMVANENQAAQHIQDGETVFLATGRQTLDRFANLSRCRLICRQIDPPNDPFPFPNGEFLLGRPPFSVADEVTLFKRLGIDWLVVKNAGGEASKTKLTAARQLKIPVIMIEQPAPSGAPTVTNVHAALDWIRGQGWSVA